MHGDDVLILIARAPLFLPLYALILFRVSGLMLTAPIFGSETLPIRLRAALAAVISLTIFPVLAPRLPADLSMSEAVFGGLGEMMIGLIMGLSMSVMFAGVQLAGMVIGQQAGLSLGQVFDPVTNNDTTIIGQMFFIVAVMAFLLVGGHRELMRALLDSFEAIPVLGFHDQSTALALLVRLVTGAFTLALRMAGPVLIALLVASVAMGFLSRTMPQLNILSVGFMLRAMLAIGATAIVISADGSVITDAIVGTIEAIREAFHLL